LKFIEVNATKADGNMKLAVVDNQFPWLASGFRYCENYEFNKIDKTILFFSLRKMHDYFPAKVHPLHFN